MSNPYESTKLVSEYLFFHYASPEAVADGMPVPHEALDFPVRLVSELLDASVRRGMCCARRSIRIFSWTSQKTCRF